MEFGGTLEGFGRRSSGTAGAFGTLRGVLGLWGEVAGAGPRRGRGLGRVEGRGRRARARRRRAPSRPPCWLVCGCQTEPDAAAAAAAAAPQAPVAPASPALPAAAAAHPGRLGGVEVSRGRRASGGGSGAPGRGPSPPQGTDSLTAPLPSSQPPRACTQVPQLGPTQVGPLSFPPGPAPRAGAWPPPHLDPSFRCKDPPPHFPIWKLFLLHPPESGALLLLPPKIQDSPQALILYLSAWNNPAPPPQSTFLPSSGQAPLSSRAERDLPPAPVHRPAPVSSRNRGRGPLCLRIRSRPPSPSGWSGALFPPQGPGSPSPPPTPTAQRGRGRPSLVPAAFCSAWDGRDPARRSCSANSGG